MKYTIQKAHLHAAHRHVTLLLMTECDVMIYKWVILFDVKPYETLLQINFRY